MMGYSATIGPFAIIGHATRVAQMSPRKGDMDADFSHTLSGGRTGLPALLEALESHLSEAGRVTVDVVDDGIPFDPTAAAAPDTSLEVEDRDVGGLGVHLVRKLMDEVAYRRDGDRNRLRFSKS